MGGQRLKLEHSGAQVGAALKKAPGSAFLTTKHWRKFHGYEQTKVCLNKSAEAREGLVETSENYTQQSILNRHGLVAHWCPRPAVS